MKCKFCGEEMPDNGKFCPYCGIDNSREEGPVDEQTVEEPTVKENTTAQPVEDSEQPVANVKKAKRFAAISGCIAAMAVLALVLFWGINGVGDTGGTWDVKSWFDWEIFRDNDIHKQDSYTVSDKKAEKKADTAVATLGNAKLTNSELQVYYQMQVIEFVNQYSYYLSYFGLDYTKPLDEQQCPLMEGYTWQQYFLDCAIGTWQQNQIFAQEAAANNFKMDSEMQKYLDELDATMEKTATDSGYTTVQEFFNEQIGPNASLEDYKSYMNTYYNSYLYFNQLYDGIEKLTDEELTKYFEANKETLEGEGIKQDGSLVTITGTENKDGSITFTDDDLDEETCAAAVKNAYAKAEEILKKWEENPTEEYFAELAKEYTADSNGEKGGLYENVAEGDMVTQFNDWCFDENRKVGDYAIVETKFGYHIMYFCGRYEETEEDGEETQAADKTEDEYTINVRHILIMVETDVESWTVETQAYYISEQAQKLIQEMIAKYELEVDYSKIALAYVSMSGTTSSK